MNTNYSKLYHIKNEFDVARLVLESSKLAKQIGFTLSKQNIIATVVSELSKNILHHAGEGNVTLSVITNGNLRGIEILAKDEGPGINNIDDAMKDHFSTADSLGLGLPAVKRMSDDFKIETVIGRGTIIIARKWLNYGKN